MNIQRYHTFIRTLYLRYRHAPVYTRIGIWVAACHLIIICMLPISQTLSLPFPTKHSLVKVQKIKLSPPKPKAAPKKVAKKKKKSPTKKKIAKKKEEKKSPPIKRKVSSRYEKKKNDLLSQLKKSLSSLDDDDDAPAPKHKKAIKDSLPKTIGQLHSEVIVTTSEEASPSLSTYHNDIVDRLRSTLHLPEYGQVKIKLYLDITGKVQNMSVIASESERNRLYLEKALPSISFPSFDNSENKEISFVIVLRNEM
jgi:colicin import membrane protein